jgi:hypothetical protein
VTLGLSFRETLSGNYWRLDAPTEEFAIAFTIEVAAASLVELVRTKTFRAKGTIDVEGLASGNEVVGTVGYKLLTERCVPYRLAFVGDDGGRYELLGQREFSGLAPLGSLTTLPASLYDSSGAETARATLRFDVRADWANLAKSVRIWLE